MGETQKLLDAVGAIYDAAQGLTGWPAVLTRLQGATGAVAAILVRLSMTAVEGGIFNGVEPEWQRAFREHYWSRNPFTKKYGHLMRPGYFLHVQPLGSEFEFRNTEFSCDFWHPQHFGDDVGLLYRMEGASMFTLSIVRPDRHPSFSRQEVRFLRALLPHMRRAAELEARIGQMAWRSHALDELFERLPQGVLLVNRRRRVVAANRLARRMLASHAGLRVDRGELRATDLWVDQALQTMIGCNLGVQTEGAARAGADALVIERGPVGPLEVLVSPFRMTADRPAAADDPLAILFLSEHALRPRVNEAALQKVFGMTKAEAHVCRALVEGAALDVIARQRRVSLNAVRGHVKAILAKTGTHRQAELVARVCQSVAVVPEGEP